MPKGTNEIKKGDRRVRVKVRTTNKIGTRKSTTGAHELSLADLRAKRENARPRDRQAIDRELDRRGVDRVVEVAEAA